jgi:hypothetical protein
METLQIEWKSEKQKSIILNLLEELQITYRTVPPENEDDDLYGKGFRESILEGKKAYESGDTSQFVKIKTADLWK